MKKVLYIGSRGLGTHNPDASGFVPCWDSASNPPKTNALAQSKTLVDYERVQVEKIQAERWDGQLPTTIYSGAPLPILNLK